jgi:hypothetical protein
LGVLALGGKKEGKGQETVREDEDKRELVAEFQEDGSITEFSRYQGVE